MGRRDVTWYNNHEMDYNVAGKTRILIKYSSRFVFSPLKTFLDAELSRLI